MVNCVRAGLEIPTALLSRLEVEARHFPSIATLASKQASESVAQVTLAHKTTGFIIETTLEKRINITTRFDFGKLNSRLNATCLIFFPLCTFFWCFYTDISAVRAEGRREQWLPSVSMKKLSQTRFISI